MKVVRKGNTQKPSWVGRTVTCQGCSAKIKLEKGDSVQFVPDQRDGDYYVAKCPECGGSITVAAVLFGGSTVS